MDAGIRRHDGMGMAGDRAAEDEAVGRGGGEALHDQGDRAGGVRGKNLARRQDKGDVRRQAVRLSP
jgi:hypothetical protein